MVRLCVNSLSQLALDLGGPWQTTQEWLFSEPLMKLKQALEKSSGHGLLELEQIQENFANETTFLFWRNYVRLFLKHFSNAFLADSQDIPFPTAEVDILLKSMPAMEGSELIGHALLENYWKQLHEAALELSKQLEPVDSVDTESPSTKSSLQKLLDERIQNPFGKICFHLAENKQDNRTTLPFVFLATFVNQVAYVMEAEHSATPTKKLQHVPLQTLVENANQADLVQQKNTVDYLFKPIEDAAQESQILKEFWDSGEIFETVFMTANQAHRFLKEIPIFEKNGISVRVPNWWKAKKRMMVEVKLGDKQPSLLSSDALLDFSLEVKVGDDELSEAQIESYLKKADQLVFFHGNWVEVDAEKLSSLLKDWKKVQKAVKNEGLTFAEGMRLLSGFGKDTLQEPQADVADNQRIILGGWLKKTFEKLKNPQLNEKIQATLASELKTQLRPYQTFGAAWLYNLNELRLGAILADDMGLGKTIQIISLLILKKKLQPDHKTFLVVPTSLLSNWKAEVQKFAPHLKIKIAHSSYLSDWKKDSLEALRPADIQDTDCVLTTYGSIGKLTGFLSIKWDLMVLDEAQAIKNSQAIQSKTVKQFHALHRIALTGTPVENRIGDLWSIFDWAQPGLLGNATQFTQFLKRSGSSPMPSLRNLVRPYILRRLKTDKSILADLPEKTELKTFCQLSKTQILLYKKATQTLSYKLDTTEGMQRRGLILSYLQQFKKICNHPSHFLKDNQYEPKASGKFLRLRELCTDIAQQNEKVLIFSQFREITEPLLILLKDVFGHEGFLLDGSTPEPKRRKLVEAFQNEKGPGYFVLSLKAGGVGLNLTAANHVIHFDRWWNPAVENQATDRAYRIGSKKNVLVHKFICQGTLEEKIDMVIEAKKTLANELLGDDNEAMLLTEMSNEELLKLVSLDITH
jgi:non-specific serine/threonine protein kinase